MAQIVATQQLTFDDFLKHTYRAFKLEGQPDTYISLPSILDRVKDLLMDLERQMEQGDHLAITLSVTRPSPDADPFGIQRTYSKLLQGYYP